MAKASDQKRRSGAGAKGRKPASARQAAPQPQPAAAQAPQAASPAEQAQAPAQAPHTAAARAPQASSRDRGATAPPAARRGRRDLHHSGSARRPAQRGGEDLGARVAGRLDLPLWAVAGGAALWLVVVLVWAAGATKWSFALFLGALLSATLATGAMVVGAARGKGGLRAARAGVVVALATYVPVVFDPHTGDVFNLPKFTLVVVASLVLAALWAVSATDRRRLPRWRNGLQWVVLAIVVWSFVCAIAGVDTHVSLLGNYGSYDGFYAAAAFGVVVMTAAECFDGVDVRRVLSALAFAGGSVVVLYGLIQLHDSEVANGHWDFINWHTSSFAKQIFSTFGNPNHLAGYLSIVLPATVVLGLRARAWHWRALAGLFALAQMAEIVRSSARGAWVATIAAFVVLAIFLAPEVRKRLKLYAGATAAVVVVAVGGLWVGGKTFLSHPLYTLFQSGSTSSVGQRFQIWRAVLSMVAKHPIFGLGPDNLALVFPRYQSASWVKALGPNYLVNGAHDIFFNYLADQGPIGLLLFLALLAFVALRAVGGWRRLRARERAAAMDLASGPRGSESDLASAHEQRLVLAVLTAGMVAYVTQATFNVQQIALSFCFWLLVGLSLVVTREAGVPATLRPAALVGAGGAEPVEGGEGPVGRAARQVPARLKAGRRPGPRRREAPVTVLTGAVALLATALTVFLAVEADRPYRADHDYWAAFAPLNSGSGSHQVTSAFFTDMKHAISLNPGEPTYPAAEAGVWASIASHAPSSQQQLNDLSGARSLYAQAVADKPLWSIYPASEAQVDGELAHVDPAHASTYLAEGIKLAQQALADNPRDSGYEKLLSQLRAAANAPAHAPSGASKAK